MAEDNEKFDVWMKEFYENKVGKKFENKYEYHRWFETQRKRRQFKFSTISLSYHLRDIECKKCLEVGCGPGTWTKLLLKRYPKAKILSLDLSEEMMKEFKQNIKDKRVKTIVKSFLDYDTKEKFDFIFCSRSIEYMPDKPKVVKKFYDYLIPGGKGLIVTSHPHPRTLMIKRMLGFKINKEHSQRISTKNLARLLYKSGFRNIRIYPILFKDAWFIPNSLLFRNLYKKRWGILSKMFATGYVAKFEKPMQDA